MMREVGVFPVFLHFYMDGMIISKMEFNSYDLI